MKITVEEGDLFEGTEDYYYAHCISADYALGAGIAVLFDKKFDMRKKLEEAGPHKYPDCILIDRVFNLVTKGKCWMKPTEATLEMALKKMKQDILERNIKKIAIPLIGCGLDRLRWSRVTVILAKTFEDTDVEFLVRYLEKDKPLLTK